MGVLHPKPPMHDKVDMTPKDVEQSKQNDSPQKFLKAIKSSKSILIIMDSRFDYDALCSVLAFSEALKQLKIAHRCVYGYKIPSKPKEYFDTKRIEEHVDLKTLDYSPYDLIVFLDSGTLEHHTKAADFTAPKGLTTLNIDHHLGNTMYGTLNYVLPRASTGSVLYDLFNAWDVIVSPIIVDYILATILTDTGLLQLDNVTPLELRTIAQLTEKGGRYNDFIRFLTSNESRDELIVKGILYSNLKVDTKKRFAYSTLLKEEADAKNVTERGTISADTIKNLRGMDFVFILETDVSFPKHWRVSLRSHNMDFDVLKIAQHFGGGGHKVAAGCSIQFSQAKTVEDVVEKIWQVAKTTAKQNSFKTPSAQD